MIAVLPFIEGAMAIEIVDAICVVVKSIQSLQSISQQSAVNLNSQNQLFQNLDQGGLSNDGSINQQILYNDHFIYDQEFQLLMNERVLKVTRHCQSLWNVIPSGLATLVTWTFSGQASRQEFIMFQTENHVGSIEFNKTRQGNRDLRLIDIRVFSYQNSVEFEAKHKKLLSGRPYERCLGTVNQVQNINFHQINSLIYLQMVCWRQIEQTNPKYLTFDPCHKISKQLARSIFYFCHSEPDYDWVLQSIFGCFTDKPMMLPHLDMIIVEKTIWNGQKLNSERLQQIENFKSMLKDIRTAAQTAQMQA